MLYLRKQTSRRNKKRIIKQFVKAINQQNLPKIIQMITEDFQFIDTYGNCKNKEAMKTGWQGYFDWFPDYLIEMEEWIGNDEFTMIIGRASGSYFGKSDKHWKFPAALKVVIEQGQQIETWQVFCDSKKQLDSMK
ncbi:nuclear transport factor 2 family protein [Enterococcus avium]|uniref:Nuclear transport factor 2 family protein n=1 Tax=Enterococcus avium TaxID=33945 RepID=A0AAW8RYU7_ENTAV|nr:nuclear transport factor 2 family protein [Enterococcus avium]MBU5367764.1 nuclear transport factor 2 family protein [Enterococcus avium]MCB6918010.1 nuclear transport factor 2 family protein [Enterococcus avium]MCQ4962106.1 nuclear transport factor 2 family protein [Enterococcus avium]MDB1726095.1 nuclear transport factor 2 family protein [Enterococcus avium]MDB1748941.1 nuclear transport factor 2 family protein [Enterococcus avium]